MKPRNATERRALGMRLAREHTIAVYEHRGRPSYVASMRTRSIRVPPDWAHTETGLASFLHELGHVLEGPCSGVGAHRRDPRERRWHNCVECERRAWRKAMELAPFTWLMFFTLKLCLGSYRRLTPAPRVALVASRRLASDSVFAERKRRELQRQDFRDVANDLGLVLRTRQEHQRRVQLHEDFRRWRQQEGPDVNV
jgi:hypothetical protein